MLIAVSRDTPIQGTAIQVNKWVKELTTATNLLAGTMVSLLDDRTRFDPLLLPLERECLRWVFDGSSTPEIARKIKQPYWRTVEILARAADKLESPNNEIQASMIAARLGILGL